MLHGKSKDENRPSQALGALSCGKLIRVNLSSLRVLAYAGGRGWDIGLDEGMGGQ